METGPILLALVDDQPAVRHALRFYMMSEPGIRVVAEAGDGQTAEEIARRLRLDVMLIDIRMPGTDGLTAISRICALPAGERPAVIALTTFDLDEYLFGALRAGAAGFLLKDGDPDLYIQAVHLAHRGHGLIDPQVTHRIVEHFTQLPASPLGPGLAAPKAGGLTPREHDIVRHVARGLSNRAIAKELSLGEGTVKSHMNHILQKLGLQSRAQVVIYAYENGIIGPGRMAR
ncbi:response regulator [Nonomuraea diastatica]|uniref:Response regulator transcription factor n=1 Tax=Nonomuraea diastatica TaxID=1848329 RepID=A0A4R4X3D0_9ACTN|nr:response regulator transcription factor [Nonomuraea diastatica]TDD24743.1 response regulator transcription factor [Nonomuraea diastatica]